MSVRIIIDSTADGTEAVRRRVTIVPMCVTFGQEQFLDGVTIDHATFYEKLTAGDVLPTTSQAAPEAFAQRFRQVVEAGQQAVVITVSSQLSGTYQSAMIAAMDFPGSIFVVDSLNVAIGTGILAELAVALAEQGLPADQIAERLTREREKIRLFAVLDTLEYLKRGGRISKTAAFAGELLSIKPLACIREGKIQLLGKARGLKQANTMLASQIREAGDVDFRKPLLMGYTGLSDASLEKFAQDNADLWQERTSPIHRATIGSVIGTHAGPGAFAVAFFKK